MTSPSPLTRVSLRLSRPNGAGKTTTINILCTLLSSTSGKTVIAGFDCSKKPTKCAPPSAHLPGHDARRGLTAYENLKFHAYLITSTASLPIGGSMKCSSSLSSGTASTTSSTFFRWYEEAPRNRPRTSPLSARAVFG